MKLRKARVQNFRSIVDSGVVEFEDRVTVFVGKNEQGKTTFLKALESANEDFEYEPGDLPNHLRPTLVDLKPNTIPIVTLWLAPEPEDGELAECVPNLKDVRLFKAIKFYDGHIETFTVAADKKEVPLEFKKPDISAESTRINSASATLREKLRGHADRLESFRPNIGAAEGHIDQFVKANFSDIEKLDNVVKTFQTSMTSLPGIDNAIQVDISTASKEIDSASAAIKQKIARDPAQLFEKLLPQFVLHIATVDKIPNEVTISEFVKSPDKFQGMANLCQVAGLSIPRIQELANTADAAHRYAFEDHYKNAISGGINEFWTQEKYEIVFHFDRTNKMSVTISDGTYGRRIPPLDRSEGFQWYLSFYAAVLSETTQSRPTVFLLDNPGLELHADGQRDIKKFMEEKLPANNSQVVYVTHSAAMIDPFNLEQVRHVELKGDMLGTKIGRLSILAGKDFDLLEPIRSAVGLSLASSLVMNQFNILVEGAADKPILEGAIATFANDLKDNVIINGSVAEDDVFLIDFYQRARLPFIVFLDADDSGRKISKALERLGVPKEKVLLLSNATAAIAGRDFELEDILTPGFYHAAVNEEYPQVKLDAPKEKELQQKRTKFYEKKFAELQKPGFNKRRVGEQVKKLILAGKVDEESAKNLRDVVVAIEKALKDQVGLKSKEQNAEPKARTGLKLD